jgi:aryl-alcohol dehydrogenase-like predicted oxidoreductase
MQYVRLGRSGLKISKILLGAMSFGDKSLTTAGSWVQDASVALPILKYAFDCGINTWDTADFYGLGSSEAIIGQAIKEYKIPRAKLVLMTKVFFGVGEELRSGPDGKVDNAMGMVNDGVMVNRVGLSRKHILDAVEASVQR